MTAGVPPPPTRHGDPWLSLGDALFAEAIEDIRRRRARPVLVGLCGPQGSGKSTTARRLASRLQALGHSCAVCSLDDFYLPRAERSHLAATAHPLLAVRGVPGTHDLLLMQQTVSLLLDAKSPVRVRLPTFDKASDERRPVDEWPMFQGPADIVLLEGWCVGARPQSAEALAETQNALERNEDSDGVWRRFVNHRLAGDYAEFFKTVDLRLMLRAPSFECVLAWRAEQERGLPRNAADALPPMNPHELSRFISLYERLSRWMLIDEPADVIADLDKDRIPTGWRRKT